MKKILTLLFICFFISSSFASRILIIRNLSVEKKTFWALDTQYYDATLNPPRFVSYYGILDAITLAPGEYILFAQYDATDTTSFSYCPESSSKYLLTSYKDVSVHPTNLDWNKGGAVSDAIFLPCGQVPPFQPTTPGNDLLFRGFKLCEITPIHIQTLDYFVANGYTSTHPYPNYGTIQEIVIDNPALHYQEIIFE